MRQRPTTTEPLDVSQFGYFLLQTHIATHGAESVFRMTVEDLSSGDKWSFASTGDLTRFLDALTDQGGDAKWAPPRAQSG